MKQKKMVRSRKKKTGRREEGSEEQRRVLVSMTGLPNHLYMDFK
jgi:hypothetical protein